MIPPFGYGNAALRLCVLRENPLPPFPGRAQLTPANALFKALLCRFAALRWMRPDFTALSIEETNCRVSVFKSSFLPPRIAPRTVLSWFFTPVMTRRFPAVRR
jgi:hypothetical protein